jgi:hypothetical protein
MRVTYKYLPLVFLPYELVQDRSYGFTFTQVENFYKI